VCQYVRGFRGGQIFVRLSLILTNPTRPPGIYSLLRVEDTRSRDQELHRTAAVRKLMFGSLVAREHRI
jgi:hypothetical protein